MVTDTPGRTIPDMKLPHRLAAGAAAFALVAGAAVAFVASGADSVDTATADPVFAAQVDTCLATGESTSNCLNSAVTGFTDVLPLTGLVELVVAYVEAHPEHGSSCHDAMHGIGKLWAVNPERDFPALVDHLPVCAYGLVHGMFENMPLPNDTDAAAARIRAVCTMFADRLGTESMEGRQLATDCGHGAGHSVSAAMPGDTAKQVETCRRAFAADPALQGECGAGALMSLVSALTEQVFTGDFDAPAVPETFETLSVHCDALGDMADRWCGPSFSPLAASHSAAMEKAYLDWCAKYPADALRTCWSNVGVSVITNPRSQGRALDELADEILEVCGIPDPEAADNASACWGEMVNGLMQRGMHRDEAVETACTQYRRQLPGPVADAMCRRGAEVGGTIVDPTV